MKARVLLLCAAVAGCFAPAQQKQDTAIRTIRQFNDDLRWARYDNAARDLAVDEAAAFLARARLAGGDLVIADQEITSIEFGADDTATVGVSFDWYNKRDMLVRSTSLVQRWALRDGRWQVTAQRRSGGARFPLVTEPAVLPSADGGTR